MRTGSSLAHLPIVLGIVLSIVAHATALYFRGETKPAQLELEAGRTVVQLTLIPRAAAKPAAPEPVQQPAPEPMPEPAPMVEALAIPAPAPEPIVDPTPEPTPDTTPEPMAEPPVEPAAVESTEQIASEIADKGVEIQAAPTAPIQPTYPRSAQKRGQEGTVLLLINVRANGSADRVTVLESSGYKLLDSAAVKAATKARYSPATKLGRAVDSELIQPIVFQLN